jgi:hypothetical protein
LGVAAGAQSFATHDVWQFYKQLIMIYFFQERGKFLDAGAESLKHAPSMSTKVSLSEFVRPLPKSPFRPEAAD